MKNIVPIILFLGMSSLVFAQRYFETKWESGSIVYEGLLIYGGDDNAQMRVSYTIDDNKKIAGYFCVGKQVDNNGIRGYFLDGEDATLLKGDNANYSADNFMFLNQEGPSGIPIHTDDSEGSPSMLVEYWREIDPKDFSKDYVAKFFVEDEPKYAQLLGLPQIEDSSESSTLRKAEHTWRVVVSEGVPFWDQEIEKTSVFPKQWISQKWSDDYYITEIGYGEGDWVVVVSGGANYTDQSWKTSYEYPKAWISEKWEEDFYITDMAYHAEDGIWAVSMSKSSKFTNQSWKKSEEVPNDWISEKWEDDMRITEVVWGGEQYVMAMTEGSGISRQKWKKNPELPREWIAEVYKEDRRFDITEMVFTGTEWFVVMSIQEVPFVNQNSFHSDSFPMRTISAKANEDYFVTKVAFGLQPE